MQPGQGDTSICTQPGRPGGQMPVPFVVPGCQEGLTSHWVLRAHKASLRRTRVGAWLPAGLLMS